MGKAKRWSKEDTQYVLEKVDVNFMSVLSLGAFYLGRRHIQVVAYLQLKLFLLHIFMPSKRQIFERQQLALVKHKEQD